MKSIMEEMFMQVNNITQHQIQKTIQFVPEFMPKFYSPSVSVENENFISGLYGCVQGSRKYKLFIPQFYNPANKYRLIVMLHGCKQTPEDFAIGTKMNELAQEEQFFVLYPGQSSTYNSHKCWNWFNPHDQLRNQGEVAIIAQMTQHIIQQYAINEQQVYVGGLSAGGAMSALLAYSYPDIYKAVAVHSGLRAGAAHDIVSALAAMKGGKNKDTIKDISIPLIVFHGDQDKTVHVSNGNDLINKSYQEHIIKETDEYIVFSYEQEGLKKAEKWIIHDAGHMWSGGNPEGSYTMKEGPDASRQMIRFFKEYE